MYSRSRNHYNTAAVPAILSYGEIFIHLKDFMYVYNLYDINEREGGGSKKLFTVNAKGPRECENGSCQP